MLTYKQITKEKKGGGLWIHFMSGRMLQNIMVFTSTKENIEINIGNIPQPSGRDGSIS